MIRTDEIIAYLKQYDGPVLSFMEVCGTHTAAIFRCGIRSLISPKIRLISGPGCPVCVTPAAYIDRCIALAEEPDTALLSFGDMLKVPGLSGSLSDARGRGARVELMYSPMEVIEKAERHPETKYVLAAVGFETTAPVFALTAEEARKRGLKNVRFLTAFKTILPVLEQISREQTGLSGFICPGHVSTIIGSDAYIPLAARCGKPFVVAGFEGEHLLAALYALVRQCEKGEHKAENYYPGAVSAAGNQKARALLDRCFETGGAMWRGLGVIPDSGLYFKEEWQELDAGSRGLDLDLTLPAGCRCADVICGLAEPRECPMFGTACTPLKPYGPCMVSAEGACGIWYRNR